MSLSAPTTVWYDVPNDLILCITTVLAAVFCIAIIKSLYDTTTTRGSYLTITTRVAVRGMKLMKLMAALAVPMMFVLFANVTTENKHSFFTTAAIMEGHWSILRIWLSSIVFMSAMLFDASVLFRIFAIIGVPMLATIDMFSQRAYVNQQNCIDRGICTAKDDYLSVNDYAIRDTVSLLLMLILTMFTIWLGTQFGFCSNEVYLPRKEHRLLSRRMAVQRQEGGGGLTPDTPTPANRRRKYV